MKEVKLVKPTDSTIICGQMQNYLDNICLSVYDKQIGLYLRKASTLLGTQVNCIKIRGVPFGGSLAEAVEVPEPMVEEFRQWIGGIYELRAKIPYLIKAYHPIIRDLGKDLQHCRNAIPDSLATNIEHLNNFKRTESLEDSLQKIDRSRVDNLMKYFEIADILDSYKILI